MHEQQRLVSKLLPAGKGHEPLCIFDEHRRRRSVGGTTSTARVVVRGMLSRPHGAKLRHVHNATGGVGKPASKVLFAETGPRIRGAEAAEQRPGLWGEW